VKFKHKIVWQNPVLQDQGHSKKEFGGFGLQGFSIDFRDIFMHF